MGSKATVKKVSKKTAQRSRAAGQDKGTEFLLRKAAENDVRFIRIWFTDILGFLKSFAITIDELEKALREGVGIDGSSIESFARSEEHDMVAMPDPTTFQILPWRPRENAVARLFADIYYTDGRPFEGDPRFCLKRQLKKAAAMGFTFYAGPEIEYFYFKNSSAPEPLDQGGYYDLTPLDAGSDLRRQTVLSLEEMGISVYSSHHEVAPSQHEIGMRYMDGLTMADSTMTYRLAVKQVAINNGLHATFMPKPIQTQNGSGMHVHQSLFSASAVSKHEEKNAFYDAKDKYGMSKTAKAYVAGLLKHAPEMAIVTNQWVNSYKRLVTGHDAPTGTLWAQRNRSALVRIPMLRKGRTQAMRAEFRSPDPACNPYLTFSVMLAAGLKGIRGNYVLPAAIESDVKQWTRSEQEGKGIRHLPTSLGEAITLAEKSTFLKEALGEHIYGSLLKNKKMEWENYRSRVSEYELKKDLPTL